MLCCEDIALKISGQQLFKEISFSLLPGSITYIKGKNGRGKTTFLRALSGIRAISQGNIYLYKHNITQILKPFALYIGHDLGLKLDITVKEQITFWAQTFSSVEMVDAAVSYWNLTEVIDLKIHSLSAGNRKKVALSRLMACNADLWLLDEVETNLDAMNQELLTNTILSKAASGGVIVLTTHQNNYIANSRVINLEDFSDN